MWLMTYLREVRAELSHISWPTPRQAVTYTILVLGISLVVSLYLGVLDFGLAWVLEKIV